MHIDRKPGEQIEVDWAGEPAQIIDPDTGGIIPAFLFVGVLTYSQYPYIEAEYYGAAEPPVRCGESHLSGPTGPPIDSHSA